MTSKTRSYRPSPALVISCLALFLTLAGTAFAATVAKNSVRSPQIVNGTIRTVDLRTNAVKAAKIAPEAVVAGKIAESAVTSSEVVDDSLTASDLGPASVTSSEVADQSLSADDLGPNSVGASEIAANAVESSEIAPNAVDSSELRTGSVRSAELGPIVQVSKDTAIEGGANASATVSCPAGTTVISGGFRGGLYQVHASGSYRSGNGWHLDARSGAAGDTIVTVYVYCLSA
jgi:hypothetical protein